MTIYANILLVVADTGRRLEIKAEVDAEGLEKLQAILAEHIKILKLLECPEPMKRENGP